MKTCYVSTPFGTKDGVDYDRIYQQIVLPAAQEAGLECRRADEFASVALIQKAILEAVIAADVMIADVSNKNANVMYELGIRHAMRRGVTILMSSDTLPFNISHSYALRYQVQGDGSVATHDAAHLRHLLVAAISERIERVTNDSPIFEYFPEIRVELPEGMQPPGRRRYAYPSSANKRPGGGQDRKTDVVLAEAVTRDTANVDPQAYIDVLKRYRNLSAWGDVVRYAESLPPEVASSPQVVQTVAHALLRLDQPDRAIELLNRCIKDTGGDAETYGMLGSIYKKRYHAHGSTIDLRDALAHYGRGYERDEQNLYLGVNLATLLHRAGGPTEPADLAKLLPRLRKLADAKLASSTLPDYWDIDSALLLSVLDRDWSSARNLVEKLLSTAPAPFLLESTRGELSDMTDTLRTEAERSQMNELLELLSRPATSEQEEEDDA